MIKILQNKMKKITTDALMKWEKFEKNSLKIRVIP
jgi:hypothetical protein